MKPTFSELIGGLMAVAAAGAIVYASIAQGTPEATTALVALSGAASGYFLRGRVTQAGQPDRRRAANANHEQPD